MVNMGHTPSIASMTTDGLLPLTHIVFEWIGGACSFSYHHPFVHRFVTLRLFVKGSLGCRLKTVFFTLFEILAICTSLRFPGHPQFCLVSRASQMRKVQAEKDHTLHSLR